MEPVRRFVDSDNSCLFSSIGYLIDNKNFSESTKYQYRQLLVNYLEDNNLEAGMLEIPKEDYIEKNPESISIYEVIRAIDEDFKINRCNGQGIGCYSKGHNSKCLTHNLWRELTNHISIFLHSISIEDVKYNRVDFKNKLFNG